MASCAFSIYKCTFSMYNPSLTCSCLPDWSWILIDSKTVWAPWCFRVASGMGWGFTALYPQTGGIYAFHPAVEGGSPATHVLRFKYPNSLCPWWNFFCLRCQAETKGFRKKGWSVGTEGNWTVRGERSCVVAHRGCMGCTRSTGLSFSQCHALSCGSGSSFSAVASVDV